jgi:uncharacterized membrane protein YfcA
MESLRSHNYQKKHLDLHLATFCLIFATIIDCLGQYFKRRLTNKQLTLNKFYLFVTLLACLCALHNKHDTKKDK